MKKEKTKQKKVNAIIQDTGGTYTVVKGTKHYPIGYKFWDRRSAIDNLKYDGAKNIEFKDYDVFANLTTLN